MPLNANALMTLGQAKEEVHEKTSDWDAILERRINGLSQSFEERTGLILSERTLSDYRVSGSGCRHIYIPKLPVQSVSSIQIRYDYDDSIYSTITDTDEFILKGKDEYGHSHTGYLKLFNSSFLYGEDNIILALIGGYGDCHPKRAQAQRLFIRQLKYEYRLWKNNEEGLLARSMGDGSVSFAAPTDLLKEVSDGLAGMKIDRI